MERIRYTGVKQMSEKDIELEIDGKGKAKIPWKVVLIVVGGVAFLV